MSNRTLRFLQSSKASAGPRLSRKAAHFLNRWLPKCRTFVFFVDFCTLQKSSKNRILQNTAKNLKSRTPDRPNVDFGMTFGVHLGIDFHEILDFVIICENHRNAYIQSISVSSAHSKPHIFRPKFNQKFILFLMPHSGPHFSIFWRVLMPKCSILGPLAAQLRPKMATKIAQVAPKRLQKLSGGKHVEPVCSQGRFRNAPGHHFGRFGMDV